MRTLAVTLLIAFAGSLASAADKDEDKAKEAAVAFMKAIKTKDVDAVMKTVEVPFLESDVGKLKVFEKTEELKADLKGKLEKIKDTDKIPTEVSEVLDLPAIRKKLEERKKDDVIKSIEKVVGDKGYVVMLQRDGRKSGAVLVRFKSDKVTVVGLLD